MPGQAASGPACLARGQNGGAQSQLGARFPLPGLSERASRERGAAVGGEKAEEAALPGLYRLQELDAGAEEAGGAGEEVGGRAAGAEVGLS